ncbi:hypothetical protein ACFL1K_04330 [Candidatus Omnitrophota bacterium]
MQKTEQQKKERVPSSRARFFVYIIESPSPNDLLNDRSEGKLLTKALELALINSKYNLVVNENTFSEALQIRLYQAMSNTEGTPILHFSSHGNKDGIGLTNGGFISWEKLKELLIPVNKALRGALVICMSSCEGFRGCRMAMTEGGDFPFFGLIGPKGTPVWSDTAVAFVTFYHLFFKGKSVVEAVKAMRIASGENHFQEILAADARQAWKEITKDQKQEVAAERLRRAIENTGVSIPPDHSATGPSQ